MLRNILVPQVWNLTRFRKYKLQIPPNISAKCHIESISYCHFSTSWRVMKFGLPLRISLYGYLLITLWQKKFIFDTINWATWATLKIYNLLLSRVFTEPIFNFKPCAEIKIYGNGYPILYSNNHLCSMHNQLRCIFQNLLSIRANW